MTDLNLTVTKRVSAPAETVFKAWLDPELLVKFMIPMDGARVSEAKVDAQEGGAFSFLFMADDEALPHSGIYREIVRYSRLVFTWQSPFSIDDSTVTLTFTSVGDYETEVVLYHEKFASEDSRDSHRNGWTSILDMLAKII